MFGGGPSEAVGFRAQMVERSKELEKAYFGGFELHIFTIGALVGWKSVLSMLLLSALPVVIKTNEGEQIKGTLLAISDSALKVEVSGQERNVSFESLLSLEPEEVVTKRGPQYSVELQGGSRIAAEAIFSEDEVLEVRPSEQDAFRVPMKQVRSIRFRRGDPETDAKWLGWLEQDQRKDLLIIRRDGATLDPQQGLITGVKKETIGFDLEGTPVDAPIERLEGVIFASSSDVANRSNILVNDRFGSQWRVQQVSLESSSETLELTIGESVTHRMPLQQVTSIRWSAGMILLADVDAAESNYSPGIQSRVKSSLLGAFFAADREGENDLRMHGGASVEYRVDEGFTKLVGSVERHPEARELGTMKVMISLDGDEIWTQQITGRQSKGFEIPLGDARRLVIRVDSEKDGDVGDTVRVARPRLVK